MLTSRLSAGHLWSFIIIALLLQTQPGIVATSPNQGAISETQHRIQLADYIGLDMERKLRDEVGAAIQNALTGMPNPVVDAAAITSATTAAQGRFDTMCTQWTVIRLVHAEWTRNGTLLGDARAGAHLGTVLGDVVMNAVKKHMLLALSGDLTLRMGQPINAVLAQEVAMAAEDELGSALGEWRCIFNPETGETQWYNGQDWGGISLARSAS